MDFCAAPRGEGSPGGAAQISGRLVPADAAALLLWVVIPQTAGEVHPDDRLRAPGR